MDSNFKAEFKYVSQHIVLEKDCCIIQNVRGSEINLVTSNNLYFYSLKYDVNINMNLLFTDRRFPCIS